MQVVGVSRSPSHLLSRPSKDAARIVAQSRDRVQDIGMLNEPKRFWIYITASGPRGVLYVGMTSDLAGRAWEHREKILEDLLNSMARTVSSTSKSTMMLPVRHGESAR